jgi:hypothetical protein
MKWKEDMRLKKREEVMDWGVKDDGNESQIPFNLSLNNIPPIEKHTKYTSHALSQGIYCETRSFAEEKQEEDGKPSFLASHGLLIFSWLLSWLTSP